MASLILLSGDEPVEFALQAEESSIGRHPDCTIQLDSTMVSRKHARVSRKNGAYFVEDLGSGNGTTVNGKPITEPTQLQNDDRVKFGPLLVRFQDPPPRDGSPLTATEAFRLDIEDDTVSSVTDSLDATTPFGQLDSHPQVKLKAVLEISRNLAGVVDLDSLLPKILDELFVVFPHADRGAILLQEATNGRMVPKAIKHRHDDRDDSVKISRTILNKVLEDKAGILSADATSDNRFQASESISDFTIRSMMCAPLLGLDGEPIGIINIDTQNTLHQFQKDDLDLLMAVAGQAALSYDNARLLVSHMEKVKQDEEMRIAENVQHALLPEAMPTIPGYDFFASYEAAQAVGGDYYDVFHVTERKVCVAFGDVAGKGVPASLVMSRMASVVESTMPFAKDALDGLLRINHHMCTRAVEGRFVTFVLVLIDLKSHQLHVANAGHMSPIIRRPDGTIEEFAEDSIGVPVGVLDEFPFQAEKRVLQPGETVVIYTDGVSEAMNDANELYGMDRLRKLVATGPADPEELGRLILADVKKHADGRPQNDDITLMSFGRAPK